MAPRKSAKITDYPINTLVRITASGGQSGDWWQRVALTGGSQLLGSYHHTIITVVHPDTGELSQQPWRTEWLEVLPQGEQLEEIEALQRAIARVKSEYFDSDAEQEQSSRNEPDIPYESISKEQLEPPSVDELPSESESSESSAVVALVEVVEDLTEEELADRQRLELTVETAFYEAGLALKELKQRKLFRSTHSNFDVYCRDRFRFSRDKADLLIKAVGIVDNLKKSDNCRTFLPTAESQVRDLVDLTPGLQCEIYAQALVEAGGKIPTRRIVKGIVERLKQRDTTPPPIPYREGDVVLIRGLGNPDLRKYDGQWAIAQGINEYTVTVALAGKDISVKPQFLEEVDPKYWTEIKAVHERLSRLQQFELDPIEDAGLEVLRRRTCFTPKQMIWLERMENDYGIV